MEKIEKISKIWLKMKNTEEFENIKKHLTCIRIIKKTKTAIWSSFCFLTKEFILSTIFSCL